MAETTDRCYGDGARLLLIAASELRGAAPAAAAAGEEERGAPEGGAAGGADDFPAADDEVYEHGAMIRIPLGPSAWRLSAADLASMRQDLATLAERFGVLAQERLAGNGGVDSVVLSGDREETASARLELVQILRFYRSR